MSQTLMLNKDEMRQLTVVFNQQAEAAVAIMNAIDQALGNTTWQGARATQFREAWNGPFKRNLIALQQALNENATIITSERNAAEAALDGVAG